MDNTLTVDIHNVKGVRHLSIDMPLTPDVYAITGINGIGKSTLLTCIAQRLIHPSTFSKLKDFAFADSSITFRIGETEEIWAPKDGSWSCKNDSSLLLRGFQEGSLTNGTRFFNIFSSGFNYYKKLLKCDPDLLIPADEFVKKNLGLILQNDANYYSELYRLDRKKAFRHYKYDGVVYYLKIRDKYISQFELSTGEFLLINLLHLLNNLLVRTNNGEKLNLILIDEIELALHPSAIKRLVAFTKDIASEYGVAVYFSTHSLEIINALPTYNLFYLHRISPDEIACETPCYPAYITRDIYTHSGYDVLILVEDDLAQFLVNRYIDNNRLDFNKRIQVLPVGGYDNTLELHQNLLQEEILQPVSHIISIIDGDAEGDVQRKRTVENKWHCIPTDTVLFLPVESLEKYLKKELFDKKNYELMRLLRDRLFKFETEVNWFEMEYLDDIENKRREDISKGRPAKSDSEYYTNGKVLFSILSAKYESSGHSRVEFREKISNLAVEYLDATEFEGKLAASLGKIFGH